nr:MaoC/PaaZ C-terminal domain-containing protein [Halomarina salina]
MTERATAIETEGAAAEGDASDDTVETDDDPDETTERQFSGHPTDGDGFANPSPPSGTDGGATADDLVGLPVHAGLGGEPTVPEPSAPGSLAAGDVGPEVRVGPFARQHFVRYAGASGDFNPVHYDEPYATGAGHPSVFGQGMLTAGVAAQAVADSVGLGRVRSFGVRFQSRVWPGDTVTARATVAEGVDADGRDATADGLVLDVAVDTDDGETVLTGTATVAHDS